MHSHLRIALISLFLPAGEEGAAPAPSVVPNAPHAARGNPVPVDSLAIFARAQRGARTMAPSREYAL